MLNTKRRPKKVSEPCDSTRIPARAGAAHCVALAHCAASVRHAQLGSARAVACLLGGLHEQTFVARNPDLARGCWPSAGRSAQRHASRRSCVHELEACVARSQSVRCRYSRAATRLHTPQC